MDVYCEWLRPLQLGVWGKAFPPVLAPVVGGSVATAFGGWSRRCFSWLLGTLCVYLTRGPVQAATRCAGLGAK